MRVLGFGFNMSLILIILAGVSACGGQVDDLQAVVADDAVDSDTEIDGLPDEVARDDETEQGDGNADWDNESDTEPEFDDDESEMDDFDEDESEFDDESDLDDAQDEDELENGSTDPDEGADDTPSGSGTGGTGTGSSPGTSQSGTAPDLELAIGHGLTEGMEGHPHHAIETQSGGFAVIGETAAGERHTAYLLVTDALANVVFKRDVGQGAWSNGNHVLQLPNGDFLIGGSVDTSNVSNADAPGQEHERAIIRVSGSTGQIMQTKLFPLSGRDAIRGLHRNQDGTIIAVGYKGGAYDDETFVVTSAEAFMMKVSADLNTVLWEKTISEFFELRKVVKAKDGQSYAAVGNIAPEGSEFVNFGMYFTNGVGNASTAPSGSGRAYGAGDVYDMDIDGDGHYILGGHTVPLNPDGSDGPHGWEGTAIKVDKTSKNMLWKTTFGNPNNGPNPSLIFDECYGVVAVPWGGYALACGSGIEPPYPTEDSPFNVWVAYVARLDTNGGMMWEKSYSNGEADDAAEYLVTTRDCGFAVFTDSSNLGGYGIYKTYPEPAAPASGSCSWP